MELVRSRVPRQAPQKPIPSSGNSPSLSTRLPYFIWSCHKEDHGTGLGAVPSLVLNREQRPHPSSASAVPRVGPFCMRGPQGLCLLATGTV